MLKIRQVSHENFEKKFTTNITGHCNVINTSGNQLLISGANGVLFASSKNLFANKDIKFSPIKQSATHHEIIDAWCIDEWDRTWLVFREARDLFISENNRIRILHGLVKNNIHPLTGVVYNPHTHKLYVGADTLQSGNEKGLQNFRSTNTGETIIRPTALHYFSNGLILVETRNSGFFIIDDEDNIHSMPRENIIQYQFPGGVRIFDDPSGKFWITSPYGMVRFRWNEKKMPVKDLEITVNQGLPNSAVRSLAFDKLNRVWAATLSGIVVIEIDSSNKNSIIVNRLSEEQGISSDYWVEAKLATDKNGYIWCGLYNQLLRFDPLQLNFEKLLPTIAIDNIQLNFKETDWLEWTDSVQGVMQLPYNPVLSYNKNNLGISYKGISFSYASALEYSYKLVGADTNWSMPTHSQIVSYVGLPPGNYNFQVRTRKSNSGWSRPAFFSFIIKKPYWETWLFRLAVLFFVIAAVVAFYKFRLNQIRKIMNLRLKISRDLHDEVGSALSGIGIISEMAKLQIQNEKDSEAKQSLEKISANAEEMLVKMSDIIWAINPQNESFEKMISRLKTYTRNVSSPLGIEMHFESDKEAEKINLDMQKINNIYLICKEAINNTVKYSGCSHLGVILKREDHYFSIYINDDGKGFDPEKVFDGNGLKNMHSRAKEMNAKLGIHSGDGKGTSVKLRINIT